MRTLQDRSTHYSISLFLTLVIKMKFMNQAYQYRQLSKDDTAVLLVTSRSEHLQKLTQLTHGGVNRNRAFA